MNVHKNARLTARGREVMIERLLRGERPADVASAMGLSTATVYNPYSFNDSKMWPA